ncbi:MAG: tyrosine-type recombinase/integrase [Acidobacteriota bacterium]|nr:tyrosine-type recombinase/integrase [Acidobacteriota bacterium]
MKIQQAIDQYVSHKRSLGMQCQAMERKLQAFCKAVGNVNVDEVSEEAVRAFMYGSGPITSNLHAKFYVLRGFYRYLLSRGYVTLSPLPTQVPKEPAQFIPYIYSREELQRVLRAAAERQWHGRKLEAQTLQALLLLLYGAGLRLSEALRLTLADADLEQHLLTIRETKFYKTRLVPLGPDLSQALTLYLAARCERGHPAPPEAFLLVTRHSLPVSVQLAEDTFKRLCREAGVRRTDGSRFVPRLHDLRHAFAVHRLTACYREGGDVQRLLPQLSTYLGHVDIGSTQRYLTLTPELLSQASNRFEQYAAPGGAV